MNTNTLFIIRRFSQLALFTIGLMLTANILTIPAQTATNELENANETLVPAALKICSVAGAGVPIGTPFTYTITTSGSGTTGSDQSFTSTKTIPAGEAATSLEMQNGNCDFVEGPFTDLDGVAGGAKINGIGSFNVGSVVTIQQTNLPYRNNAVIASAYSPIRTFPEGKATVTIINGENIVFFVDSVKAPKSRKRVKFF